MSKMTPMFQQYMSIKEKYPDAILLFRMGDFYEMFFQDAEEASSILDIALTSRNKEKDIKAPMCGVPAHSARGYIMKLVQAGKKVAICEQVEDPKKAKGIVRREVVRVLTPGLLTEDEGLRPEANNYLVALLPSKKRHDTWGCAFMDLSTGEFRLTELQDERACLEELFRLEPSELLFPEELKDHGEYEGFFKRLKQAFPHLFVSLRPIQIFRHDRSKAILCNHFKVSGLEGFGVGDFPNGVGAAGALLFYVKETQKGVLQHIRDIRPYHLHKYLVVDEASKRNLELVSNNIDGGKYGTLLSVLDRSVTPMGARLLRKWILYPLRVSQAIVERLDAVETLFHDSSLREGLAHALRGVRDLERLLTRAVMGTLNPRDLLALRDSLSVIPTIKKILSTKETLPGLLNTANQDLDPLQDLFTLLKRAIREDAPVVPRDGGIIKEGFDQELDRLLEIQRDAKGIIARMEARERERTGIPSLRIGFNKVFGYYIEVTKTHREKVPEDYIRKQTLVNAERFITNELKELEEKILNANERRVDLENRLFDGVRKEVIRHSEAIQQNASLIARIDVLLSLARVAVTNNYTRPSITQDGTISLEGMRHPIVEGFIGKDAFVPNSIFLDDFENQFLVITGPNMAGKSTVLRSTALCVLMGQMGSFVPCEKASVSIVDRIFTRVGATDYLSRGQSTFMVEMAETANILHNATSQSLVILDEIGRGTSTYDGLAIAWAVSEALLDIEKKGVKTLFATHYHELTRLAKEYSKVKNYSIAVKEWGDEIVFLYELREGPSNKSYGIHVAALAGVPSHVVERAKELLEIIEKDAHGPVGPQRAPKRRLRQLELPLRYPECFNVLKNVGERIRKVDIENTTPLEALNFLAMLKDELKIN